MAGGIDTIADLQALIVMGCDFGQGALVAPPFPKDRFLDALRQYMNKPRAPRAPGGRGQGTRRLGLASGTFLRLPRLPEPRGRQRRLK